MGETVVGITWETFAFLAIAGLALGYASYQLWTLWRLLRAHKGHQTYKDSARFSEIPQRIVTTIANVFGQKAVLRKRGAGLIHATIFWGFIIITIGTVEQFWNTIWAGGNFEFIGETLYRALVFLMDAFVVLVLIAVLLAAYRRFILRPPHLGQSRDANYILLFTGALMISILLMNAFLILGEHPWFAGAMPFSSVLASILSGFSPSEPTALLLSKVFKWVHMLIVLGFAAYIPSSKHLHVVAAGPNTFFKNLTWQKKMKSIDFEDESIEQYGAAKATDLSWKDALDYYSCTECGRCQEVCPAWNTQKPLSPKNLIMDLRNALLENRKKVLAGEELPHILDEQVTEEVIWSCTSCRACEVACPVFIEHTDKIYDVRRNLVMMESRFPQEVQTVFKNMETNATPWAFSHEDRANWAEGMSVKTVEEDGDIEYLLWVGCAGAYDDRNRKVIKSLVRLLKKAEIRFSILGKAEKCTGDPARRIGNEYLFQTLAKENVETLNRHQIKKIVTTCPHCFNTIGNEYKDFGGDYQVEHHTELLARLIKEGRIKPTKNFDESIAYHDSCYLGRWNGVFEEPRSILKSVPAARVSEMKNSHEKSLCCGAGGGRMWMEENTGTRVNIARTEQALETNSSVVASNCPFCLTMINDGVKSKEMQDKVRVLDVAEILDETTT